MDNFHATFREIKNQLIEKIVFPCFKLTPNEANSFYLDPQEFTQSFLQIVDRESKQDGDISSE